jgi:hypothetical protein
MSFYFRITTFLLGLVLLLQACTGQKPADLKNSTTPRRAVKASCSSMAFEGQILSKKNVLEILDCSGWSRQYPELTQALIASNEIAVNAAFKPINDILFSDKKSRKQIFDIVAESQANGEMDAVSNLLQKSLSEHNAFGQLNLALNHQGLQGERKSAIMKVLSESNAQNLRYLKAFRNILNAYENHKGSLNSFFNEEEKIELVKHLNSLLGDFASNMDGSSWGHLSGVLYQNGSPIQQWAQEGRDGDLRILLDIIEEKNFYHDVYFLKRSLDQGITCSNRSNTKDFNINVGQELKHKIEGLKSENKETFESLLLHGLTKYLAFQEFCEEPQKQQGLKSFFAVLQHAFNVLLSEHDYRFLKRIHQVFGQDRFVFLSFLSSQSFLALKEQLTDFKGKDKDEDLVRTLYDVVSDIPLEDFETISVLVNELTQKGSQTLEWQTSWAQVWKNLSLSQRNDLIDLAGIFLSNDVKASQALNFATTVLEKFPELSVVLAKNLNDDNFQTHFRYLIELLSQEQVQKELSVLLSKQGLFEFVEVITQNNEKRPVIQRSSVKPQTTVTYVEPRSTSKESIYTRACFDDLSQRYQNNTDYYGLVNVLPESCLTILGRTGFVGQIYLWMNASHAYFKDTYGVEDFHSATGVWAPGMLQFIFSAAVEADQTLKSLSGKVGILQNIDEIHRVVTDPNLMEAFHQFSKLFVVVDQKFNMDKRLLDFINQTSDEKINEMVTDGFLLLTPAEKYLSLQKTLDSCEKISRDLGANPCFKKADLVQSFTEMLRIIKRKNERGVSLATELVKWIHPQGGIDLPFSKVKSSNHKTSLDEIIRFVHDLSGKQTAKTIIYQTVSSSKVVEANILDRLEVVIRDIAFVNNFYGAYFKNDVAAAKNYQTDVKASEKLLVLLDRSSGIFRATNGLPDDSKYRLKNVRATYSSLIELDNNFLQADGSPRRYGPMIQSMLAAIASSSRLKTQDFNPYRIPEEKVVEGHNGELLTKVVQMSGLRHLSNFVRARFDDKLSALNSRDFKQINTHLIGRHKMSDLQNALQRVLDKYLDKDRRQLNLLVEDAVSFIGSLTVDEQHMLEELMVKALVMLSDTKISNDNFDDLAALIELSIEMWPEIREILLQIEDRSSLISMLNKFLDRVVVGPELINRLFSNLKTSKIMTLADLKESMRDKNLINQSANLLNRLIAMHGFKSEINWIETLQAIFSQEDTEWEALKKWLQQGLGEDKKKLTVSLLISFLGEKNAKGYNLKLVMDELFINHRPELEQFLSETFKSLEFISD